MKFNKSKLPSRHVSIGVKSAAHRSMYYAYPKKREELPPRVQPKPDDTITKHINAKWIKKDTVNLKHNNKAKNNVSDLLKLHNKLITKNTALPIILIEFNNE